MVTKEDTASRQRRAESIVSRIKYLEVEGCIKNSGGILGNYTRFQLDGDAEAIVRAELAETGIGTFLDFPLEDAQVWYCLNGCMRLDNGLYAKMDILNFPALGDKSDSDMPPIYTLDRDYHFSPKPSVQYGIPFKVEDAFGFYTERRNEPLSPETIRRIHTINRLYFVVESLTLFDNKDSKQPLSGPFRRVEIVY